MTVPCTALQGEEENAGPLPYCARGANAENCLPEGREGPLSLDPDNTGERKQRFLQEAGATAAGMQESTDPLLRFQK